MQKHSSAQKQVYFLCGGGIIPTRHLSKTKTLKQKLKSFYTIMYYIIRLLFVIYLFKSKILL